MCQLWPRAVGPCDRRMEYSNKAHRMNSAGDPWSDARGSLARATDRWVRAWMDALRRA